MMTFSYEEIPLAEECDDAQIAEALKFYSQLIEHFPEDYLAQMNMAYLYLRQKNYSKALEHAGLAMNIDHDDLDLHFLYAQLYMEMGGHENYVMAEETLNHLALAPNIINREFNRVDLFSFISLYYQCIIIV